MKGEKVVGIAASAEFFDKRDREEMDRDASALENQIAGGVALMGEFGWKIAVFDDEHGFVAGSKDADFFLRIAFWDHLARHLRFFVEVKSEEGRVDDVGERIIDLEIGDRIDSALFHFIDGAAAAKSAEGAAMSVGRHCDPVFCFE